VVLVLQQTNGVKQYALAVMSGDPVDMGDHYMLPVDSVLLNSNPLTPGLTGLSASGLGGNTEALQAQINDLENRIMALEELPPSIPEIATTSVTAIIPATGKANQTTRVVIKGTGFNSFGAYRAALGISATWFDVTLFNVDDDNTISATVMPTADGPGLYNLAVWFNAADVIVLPGCFTYT
jgi:hypothetical protein